MTYKDLNVYQRAYKVAIDFYHFLQKNNDKISTDEINQLIHTSKEISFNIAEGFYQRSPKAKRFLNFKAVDLLHRLLLEIDFLHDTNRMSQEDYDRLYGQSEICVKQLFKYNQSILTTVKKAGVETENKKELVSA